MDLGKIMRISAAGMKVQSARMEIVAENMANAEALPGAPGVDPYRRKMVTFKNVLDRELGVQTVALGKVALDPTEFGRRYEPGHPGADPDGYVRTPNVKSVIEMMDLRAAQRSYEANLNVIQVSKSMVQSTLSLLNN